MPQALQLLHSDAAGGDYAPPAGLSRQLAGTLQHATLSGVTTVSMLVPLQQLLWMLTASEQKVPPSLASTPAPQEAKPCLMSASHVKPRSSYAAIWASCAQVNMLYRPQLIPAIFAQQ